MNSVNRNNNTTPKPRLIILEQYAASGDEHADTVAKNALLVNPDVQITKINERSGYYRASRDKGLKHWIQSFLRGYLKGNYESLQAIAADSSVRDTVVNISQGYQQFHILELSRYPFFIRRMTDEEKKRLVSSPTNKTLNLSNVETFIDKAWNEMKEEIKSWQAKIKKVVLQLKKKNVAVVQSAGNEAGTNEFPGLNSKEFKHIKPQFEPNEAIDPMMQGTEIIGVGAAKAAKKGGFLRWGEGDLTDYSTRGNHYRFATTVPDGENEGTSLTSPAIGTGLSVLLAKGYTVDQALAHLRKIGIKKKDDEGNPYIYISLEKLKNLKKIPSLKKRS